MNMMTNIIIPFDFPFAILEHQHNPDPHQKLVYAVADGQYTYGPLSLFQYHNDQKYAKIIEGEELPVALPCKEFYIVESDCSIDDAIEIIDRKRGRICVKEMIQENEGRLKELIQEISECKNEIRSLKSIVLSEGRITRSIKSQVQQNTSAITTRNLHTPPSRSHSVTTNRVLLKNVRSSGYGQPSYATPKRSLRK